MRYLSVLAFAVTLLSSCNNNDSSPKKEVKQYTIDQFYKTKNIGGGVFNKDETKIAVNNNETGIYNVYEINLADTSMKPITNSAKESFFVEDYVAGTDNIIYSADQGGNENSHLYLLHPGDSAKDLTAGKKEKTSFFGWNKARTILYYTSNKRDPKYFDLYKMDTATWASNMIYRNDSGYNVNSISYNEQYLLLTKTITTDANEMYLYDAASKQMKKISADAEAAYSPAAFELNDSAFYYTTNEGKEFAYLVKYNIAGGQKEKVFETNWDVAYMYLSENGKYRVIGINEDGRNKVLIFNHATGEQIKFPEVPDGDVQGVNISMSEKNMILTVGSDKSPNNLWLYNFETQKLKQLTNTLNAEINHADLVKSEVVRFKSFDGVDVPAIYYRPLTASKDKPVPALVWVHGGPGGQSRAGYSQSAQYFLNHGYAILMVNNRGSSGYGKTFHAMDDRDHGDKDLMDCVYGKRWLAKQEYIDSSKIGIYGGSYGGFMSLAGIIQYPNEFKVGVDLYGVANWPRTLKSVPPYWESFRKALYTEMGDPYGPDSTRLRSISPLYNTEKIKTPLLVLQGSNDPRVLQAESDEIVAGAKKNGTPVEYVLFPDEGHGFIKKENQMKAAETTLKFLDKYLKNTPKTGLN
ncbi:MAG: secreted prolyl oligopeptidase family protein [Chitinophagaceae bacterium]|nr:secreted prolyl oligopeptidase family protein [Chitinophagaceae bacterium]